MDKRRVYLEMFNECMIMMCQYHMILFSDFVALEEAKFQMGMSYVIFLLVTILVNLANIFHKGYVDRQRLKRLQ